MLSSKSMLLIESIRRLARRGNVQNLRKIVGKTRPADLAHVFTFLAENERGQVFRVIENTEKSSELLSELESGIAADIVEDLEPQKAYEILRLVPNDDLADILEEMDEEKAESILALMKDPESEQVSELMQFGSDTAGGIMSPDIFALPRDTTAQESIDKLRGDKDVEMAFYIYVKDDLGHLVGVCSLRQLVVNKPDTPISEIMETSVVRVNTDTDQEEVARLVHRYGLLAVPVVDDHNVLVGIVTVDDVIDVIREEATEDILKMAGAGESIADEQKPLRAVRNRLPWLFAAWVGGVASIWVIGAYENALQKVVVLAAFIPVIMGMGGNIGNQAATLVVRGLALGRINISEIGRVLVRQGVIAVILGIVFGGLLALVVFIFFREYITVGMTMLPLVVGLAIFAQMVIAALLGSLLPMLFERFRVDPAVATGPLVTTSMDLLGIVIYFNIAFQLLEM